MWTWWKSKISGEVPLMYNPSEDLLLNHSRLMKNIDPKEELVFLDEFKNEINISHEVLKNINFFKPVVYSLEGEFLSERGKLMELRMITTLPQLAAYFRKARMRKSTSKIKEIWTIYHTHLNTFPWKDLKTDSSRFAFIDQQKAEIWMAGDFHPGQLSKIFDYLGIKPHQVIDSRSFENPVLESRS
jgi:hypothetical protein